MTRRMTSRNERTIIGLKRDPRSISSTRLRGELAIPRFPATTEREDRTDPRNSRRSRGRVRRVPWGTGAEIVRRPDFHL